MESQAKTTQPAVSLARSSAVMSVGTVLSRVTGVIRLAAIAAALGVSEDKLADTYNLANTFPNIVYELILGGILTSVFVPVFVELLEKEGRERAWEVAGSLISLAMVVLGVVAVIGIIAAPWIASFYAVRLGGDEAALQREVMTFLLRLFVPQIVFYGLAAMTTGLLNAHKRFASPTFTPVLNNLAVAAVFVAFHQAYGAVELPPTDEQLWVMGAGTTLGVALMALAQLPFLRGLGRYRPRLTIGHPAVKKLAGLSAFVVGVVVVRQISYLAIQWLANAQTGGYSAYLAAYTFFILPQSLFALSVATALLPTMSEHAVHERWDEFRERLSLGMRATLLFIVPSAAGYLVLGRPIVEVLLENGVMTASSTSLVSAVLAIFVLGLPQFAIFQLLMRAFYALQDSKTPFLLVSAAAVVNMAINVPMFALLGVQGLAIGEAIAYTFAIVVAGRLMSRRIDGIDGRAVGASALRICAAAAGMALLLWPAWALLDGALTDSGAVVTAGAVALLVGLGAGVYLALARLLGVRELVYLRRFLPRPAGEEPARPGL